MSNAIKYLENLQGLILYNQNKYGETSLKTWLDLPEDIFEERVIEFKENYKNELNNEVYEERKKIHTAILFKDKMDAITKEGKLISKEEKFYELQKYATEISGKEILFSKFESINFVIVTKMLQSIIYKSGKKLGFENGGNIIVGTVATQGINACAISLENNDGIILLERNLMSLLHLTAKVIIQSFLKQEHDESDKIRFVIDPEQIKKVTLEKNSTIALKRFKETIIAFVKGSPLNAEFYELDDEIQLDLAGVFLCGAETFVAGHEYGHIVKKHRTDKRKIFCINPMDGIQNHKWDKEFEADNVGIQILLDSMAEFDFEIDFQYIGAEMFFIIYEIADRALRLYLHGSEEAGKHIDSHPPYKERIKKLRNYISDYPNKDVLKDALYFADSLKEILEFFWKETKSDVLNLHNEKI